MKTTTYNNNRSIKKYNFTLKYNNKRPNLTTNIYNIKYHNPFNKIINLPKINSTINRKRKKTHKKKRPIKKRIKTDNPKKSKKPLPNLKTKKIIKIIIKKLNKPKNYLFNKKTNILLHIYYVNILNYNYIPTTITIYYLQYLFIY